MNAWFAVLRFTPDIVRNETANIGVIGFFQGQVKVLVDDAALRRIVSSNSGIAWESVGFLREVVRGAIEGEHPQSVDEFRFLLAERIRFPLSTSPINPFTVQPFLDAGGQMALLEGLEKLSQQLVHPRRRSPGKRTKSPRETLRARLAPAIRSERVIENYTVLGGKSRTERPVSFYANHGSDVGLEIPDVPPEPGLNARIKSADALAYTAEDIMLSPKGVNSLVVYVPSDLRRNLGDFEAMARARLEGMENVTVVDLASAAVGRFLADAKLDVLESTAAD